jgi:ubiquinone/menaquinone biosynthesis C-methylase UbiE
MTKTLHYQEEIRHRLGRLRCPDCLSALEIAEGLICARCNRNFADETTGFLCLLPGSQSLTKQSIQGFWGDIYRQWHAEEDRTRTQEGLKKDLDLLEDLFRRRQHLAVVEMPLTELAGKEILEIGSGAGGHSALFRRHGANVTSLDITPQRVAATMHKLDLLREVAPGSGLAVQGDAENLPFGDHSFDIVYSNGVLHHTEATGRCIEEVFRVLKPGGQAVIMLYAKHSAEYWLVLVPWGILTGWAFRLPHAHWLGRATEGRPKFQGESNPVTQLFTKAQVARFFNAFERTSLRKNGFLLSHLPLPKRAILRDKIVTASGGSPHDGGRIVYGTPMVPETRFELTLGRLIGCCWNIKAVKARS